MGTRSSEQTTISISLSVDLLKKIDARAEALRMARSRYLVLAAEADIYRGGPLEIVPTMESDSMDLAREITEFLRCAVPTLANYQRRKEEGTLPVPPEEVVAPDRENRFWKDFLEDQEDILTLKWFESQNAGRDIGFERALQFWLKDGDRWRTTPGGGEE